MAQLFLLWAVFLALQMAKSKHGHCTKEYLLLFVAQTVFCISVTVFFVRRELAELGQPAGEQRIDPEIHELLIGERSGVPAGMLPQAVCFVNSIVTLSVVMPVLVSNRRLFWRQTYVPSPSRCCSKADYSSCAQV